MLRRLVLSAVVVLILPSLTFGVATEIYEWSGGGAAGDWFDTANWTVIESPIGLPVSINPAPRVTDFDDTRTHVVTTGDIPVLTSGAADARSVRLGRAEGAGQMDMSGGTLTIGDKLRIGNHKVFDPNTGMFTLPGTNPGTMNVTGGSIDVVGSRLLVGDGSPGFLNINEDDGQVVIDMNTDFRVDFGTGFDLDSVVNVSGDPEINVGDDLELGDNGSLSNFSFNVSGGTISVADDFQVRGGPTAELSISGGLMKGADQLDVDSLVSLSGTGVLRAEFLDAGSDGTININDDSKLQLAADQTSFTAVLNLILDGTLTTDGPGALGIQWFVDPDFFGSSRAFYQVSLAPSTIPEPTGVALVVLGALCMISTRRKSS